MHRRSKAALAPAVLATAIAGAAGFRAQNSGPGKRLDELSVGRPAAASHFPAERALTAASKAAAEARRNEGFRARQSEAFLQAAAGAEALEAQRAQHAQQASRKAPARTGRGGGSGSGCSVGSIVQRESKGDPNVVNPSSGAGGKYQFLPSTWSGDGGYAPAQDASEPVQDERFHNVYVGGAGASHWAC